VAGEAPERAGGPAHGASAIGFVLMLGGATGISLCGIVLEWRLAARHLSQTSRQEWIAAQQ
jgi:hypothetical protein